MGELSNKEHRFGRLILQDANNEAQGKILHTRSHTNESLLTNVTESPLDNSSKDPPDA